MIKTSNKAARKLGADLAIELHAQRTVAARGGVIAAKSVILDQFGWLTQSEIQDGFNAKLDELEPLTFGRRGQLQ
jgi:hypothetical protein